MVGGSIPGREIVSLLDEKLARWSNASCVPKKKTKVCISYVGGLKELGREEGRGKYWARPVCVRLSDQYIQRRFGTWAGWLWVCHASQSYTPLHCSRHRYLNRYHVFLMHSYEQPTYYMHHILRALTHVCCCILTRVMQATRVAGGECRQAGRHSLSYVGVIWFAFHALQLLLIRLTQPISCCISNSTMKHLQKNGLKIGSPFTYLCLSKARIACWFLN